MEKEDDKIFNRKCAGDEREYTPEEEEYIGRLADLYLDLEKKKKNEGGK